MKPLGGWVKRNVNAGFWDWWDYFCSMVLVTITGDLGSDYMEAREINNNSIEGQAIVNGC